MSELMRPEPASAELVERAAAPRTAVDEIASAVGWWMPEILAATGGGVGGALLVHPVLAPVAGLLLAARITVSRLAYRRALRERSQRWAAEHAEMKARHAAEDHTAAQKQATTDRGEEIA